MIHIKYPMQAPPGKYKKADCGDGEKNAKRQGKNTPRPILQRYKDNIGRTAGNNKTKGANQSPGF